MAVQGVCCDVHRYRKRNAPVLQRAVYYPLDLALFQVRGGCECTAARANLSAVSQLRRAGTDRVARHQRADVAPTQAPAGRLAAAAAESIAHFAARAAAQLAAQVVGQLALAAAGQ